MAKPRKRVVSVLGGSLEMTVNVAGKGKPLLFLHSAGGFYWDDFLDELSEHYKVYAPHFPGTAPGRPNDIEKIDNLWDTVIAYEDLLDALKIKKCILMGHSFGGLLASELAAQRPKAILKLILIAPIGLWTEKAPYSVWNWCSPSFEEIMDVLFYDKSHLTLSFGHDAAYAFHFLLRVSIQIWSLIVFSGYFKPQGELIGGELSPRQK